MAKPPFSVVAGSSVKVDNTYISSTLDKARNNMAEITGCVNAIDKMMASELNDIWQGAARTTFDAGMAKTVENMKTYLELCGDLMEILESNSRIYGAAMAQAEQLVDEIK